MAFTSPRGQETIPTNRASPKPLPADTIPPFRRDLYRNTNYFAVAIFVAFAWLMEAAVWIGLVEPEPQDPDSRAYRIAYHGFALLKKELGGAPLQVLDEHRLLQLRSQVSEIIEVRGSTVGRVQEGLFLPFLDLGPGGSAHFRRDRSDRLEVRLEARTDDGGRHSLELLLPVEPSSPRPEPKI